MNEKPNHNLTKSKKIMVWLLSFVISAFFILSAFGWFAATWMASSGILEKEATDFYRSLTPIDKFIRTSQVIGMSAGCILLLFSRQLATKIFLTILVISIIFFFLELKWVITFLTPLTVFVAFGYAYWVGRNGYLH